MPVLHLRLNSNKTKISLAKDIHAQDLIFIRSIIRKNVETAGTYNGAIMVNLNKIFNGFELISSTNLNSLMIPVNETIDTTGKVDVSTVDFNQNLSSEDIRQEFYVETYNYDGVTPATFGTGSGEIKSVDLFFQISEINDYSTY
jgi:hypothetical protein